MPPICTYESRQRLSSGSYSMHRESFGIGILASNTSAAPSDNRAVHARCSVNVQVFA
jgi:hypothetical protein